MKIKAWMIYLVVVGIVYGISRLIADPFTSGYVFGAFVLYGGIAMGLYYLSRRLWFGKKCGKKINN